MKAHKTLISECVCIGGDKEAKCGDTCLSLSDDRKHEIEG
jgi:hypothetical protein